VLDCQAEIDSDLSVFHRVDDPMQLPSARFFTLAELLPCYAGAVRAHFQVALAEDAPRVSALSPGEEVRPVDDPRALEALTNQNGFAGFEYVGGG
jgi:hypothetical protein